MIKRCKSIFEKTTQLMIASERSVGKKHYKKSYPFSPKLNEAATRVIEIRKTIRRESIKTERNLLRLKLTKEQLSEVYTNLRKVQKQSVELREIIYKNFQRNKQFSGMSRQKMQQKS